ncbi:transketolase family protein [Bacteroidota bacterium]
MRNSFINALEEFSNDNTILITGDLGFGVLTNFEKKYPQRYINAGVAEQNLTGIAAGLALEGKKVITYSIANFNTLRALEQIRNDIAYHNLNVIIVSVGCGLAYGQLGISHHATEDIAIMRSIPNMSVFAPGDTMEAYLITKLLLQKDFGPVYLRIGRAGEATIHTQDKIREFEIGKPMVVRHDNNNNIALFSTGGMLKVALDISNLLNEINESSSVYSFHTLKPINSDMIHNLFKSYKYVFSFEEHTICGGFGSLLLESLIGKSQINLERFYAFALTSEFTSIVGDQNYLRDYYDISTDKIFSKIKSIINV